MARKQYTGNESLPLNTPQPAQNPTARVVNQTDNSGNDRLSNGLADVLLGQRNVMGFGSQLSQLDTMFINNRWYLISNNRNLLSQSYVEHGLIQTIVDIPVDDGLRGGVIVKSKQLAEDQIQDLMAKMDRENDINIVGQALKWNRLFGGAGVLLMTGQDPTQPLNIEELNPDSPFQLRDVDMWELFESRQNTSDYSLAMDGGGTDALGEPEFYDYYGKKLHKSHVLRLRGLRAPSFIRPRMRGWGFSVVESLVRSINQYLKACDLGFEVLDEFKVDVYKIKGLTNSLLSNEGEAQIRKRVDIANRQKNYQNAITMDMEDEYDHKQLSFAGLAEAMAGIRMQVAADMRIPLTKLFGISAAGFNSGEDDIEVYNSMVESQVRSKSKYDILRVVEIRCQQMFGYIPDDLQIEFKPLRVMSAPQEEEVKTAKFNRLLAAKQAGELDTVEFRDACNKDNLLSVQLDTHKEMLDTNTAEDQEGDEDPAEKKPEAKAVPAGKSSIAAKDAPKAKNSIDERYSLMNFKGPRIVTVGLVSGYEILTGKRRDNGLWTSPGGHMDDGETVEQAACREVLEETGIEITKEDLHMIEAKKITSHRTGKEFVLFAFLANIPKERAVIGRDPDQEISEWKWVKLDPATPELVPEVRHAKEDTVLQHLFHGENI